jgi:hypothetical protein
MATVLYARVSTAEQTIEDQLAHARAAGFAIDEVVADNVVVGLDHTPCSAALIRQTSGWRRARCPLG